MAIHFNYTSQFEEARSRIEQHLYDSVLAFEKDLDLAIRSVEQFSKAIDRLAETLEQMYQTHNPKDFIGEKSFPIRDGRYRVFSKSGCWPATILILQCLMLTTTSNLTWIVFPHI